MSKIIIPWDDGSGDSFYIDYTGIEGSSESLITSDTNLTGVERRKTLVFRTTTANVGTAQQAEAYLTVVQRTDSLIVAMFKGVVSIYDDKKAGYKIDEAQYLRTQLGGYMKTSKDEKIQLKEE
jgi:hypothetical protein